MTNSAKRTKQCIQDAFIRVLETKSFASITVNDVIQEACVSKSTFYKYCNGKYELAEQFFDRFKVKSKEKTIKVLQDVQDRDRFYEAVAAAFNNNRIYFSVLLKIKDEFIDLEKQLLTAIQYGIAHWKKPTSFEEEYMANNLFWAWGFCMSLNRYITVEDIALIDEKIDLPGVLTALIASSEVPKP